MLFHRIASWLKPGGLLFFHVFRHNEFAYHFVDRDTTDWMTRYFFAGGLMPSHDLFSFFQEDLRMVRQWKVNGRHYWRTCEQWLENQDRHRAEIMPLFETTYGKGQALCWFTRWRLFYLSCAELFRYEGGEQWGVSHFLFEKPVAGTA